MVVLPYEPVHISSSTASINLFLASLARPIIQFQSYHTIVDYIVNNFLLELNEFIGIEVFPHSCQYLGSAYAIRDATRRDGPRPASRNHPSVVTRDGCSPWVGFYAFPVSLLPESLV